MRQSFEYSLSNLLTNLLAIGVGVWSLCKVCVLAFFGERGPIVVGPRGDSGWSGMGGLGARRSVRTGPGGLPWAGPSV